MVAFARASRWLTRCYSVSMKLLAEISEATLGLGVAEQLGSQYELRKSARAILLNEEGKMATQYLARYNYHKLPGGGVDPGESIEEALVREVREEVGCDCIIERAVGMVIEYRNKYMMLHISYGFVARVVGEVCEPKLETSELLDQQETLWLHPSMVWEKMKNGRSNDDSGELYSHFTLAREAILLAEYVQNHL